MPTSAPVPPDLDFLCALANLLARGYAESKAQLVLVNGMLALESMNRTKVLEIHGAERFTTE